MKNYSRNNGEQRSSANIDRNYFGQGGRNNAEGQGGSMGPQRDSKPSI